MVYVEDEYYLERPDDYELFSAGNISVPFKWEEAPGKPTIAYDQILKRQEADQSQTTVLQLPPILQWKQSTMIYNNDTCDQCNHTYNGKYCGYGSCSCSTKSANCSNRSKCNGGSNHECCPSGRWAAPVLCFSRSSRRANKKLKRLVNCSWVMVWRRARKLTHKSAAAANCTSSSAATATTPTTSANGTYNYTASGISDRRTSLSSDSSRRYDQYSSAVMSLQELMIAHEDPVIDNIDAAGNPPPSTTKRTPAATPAVPTYGRTY